MVNSQKGLDFYDSVRSKFREKEIRFEDVVVSNKALISSLSKPTFDREKLYEDLANLPFGEFAKKYVKLPAEREQPKLRNLAKFIIGVKRASGWSLRTWCQNIYYNCFCKHVKAKILEGKYLFLYKHSVIDIAKTGTINVNGALSFGIKRVKGSHLESRLLVDSGAVLDIYGGAISYGADIEVFPNSHLVLGKGIAFNINATIICGDHIKIEDGVCFGRNVTVRDNSGEHFMSRKVYKNKRPVIIGQHSWITEQSIVMPGAKIGVGVIVGAGSMVQGKLPNFTLATGRPAEVIDEEIFWKQ
jgi:acetyltransferase-like isoleucine patch superfamily enzyme